MNHRSAPRRNRRFRGSALTALSALCMLPSYLACQSEDATDSPAATPQRIASLSPLATALLLELDAVDRIVAVDADSGELAGLGGRPTIPTSDETAFLTLSAVEPDLIIVPESRADLSARLAGANFRTVIAAVHDFDDGFTLWGELAGRLGVAEAASPRIADASRPLAQIAAASHGFSRPRVAAIETFAPLALVGDRRLETALIAVAGGESVSHGSPESALPIDREALHALAPDLLLHASPRPIEESERRRLVEEFAAIAPLVFVELDPARLFVSGRSEDSDDPKAPGAVDAARTLRAAIAPLAHPLAEAP